MKRSGGQAAAYFVAIAQQDEEKAWKFYKAMFANRDRLVSDGEDFLKKTAQSLDVDMKRLSRDVRGKKVSDILAEDQQGRPKAGRGRHAVFFGEQSGCARGVTAGSV